MTGRRQKIISLVLSGLVLSPSIPARAAFLVGPGATGFTFLKIPVAARPTAMAGAFTAVAGDSAALEYNPAGLTEIERVDFSATLINFIEDTKLQSFNIAFPVHLSNRQRLGDSFLGPDSGKLIVAGQYRSLSSNDTARDSIGISQGEFEDKDQLFQFGLGYAPFERLAAGVSGKYISSTLYNNSVTNYAFDAGLIWKFNGQIQGGLSILNAGPDKAYISLADPLPTTLRAGLAYQSRQFLVTSDVSSGRDKITQEALGLEWKPIQLLRLRGGVLNDTAPGFSGGIGLFFSPSSPAAKPPAARRKAGRMLDDLGSEGDSPTESSVSKYTAPPLDFAIDYAFQSHNNLDITHTFSLKILY